MTTDDAEQAARDRESGDWYVARMDEVDAMDGAAETRARSYDVLRLAPGAPVVDVGCCSGRAVAELDGRGHHAIGVDLQPRVVEVAAERHPTGDFRVGSAYDLPLADAEAAGYRADKVFHLLDVQEVDKNS